VNLTLGERIYYTGDRANAEDAGTIVAIRPPNRWGPECYDVDLDDGRHFPAVYGLSFDPGSGRRFWPLDEWQAHQAKRAEEGLASMLRAIARSKAAQISG